MITRDVLINMIYNDSSCDSCPSETECIAKGENVKEIDKVCKKCAEKQLENYENKIKDKAIKDFVKFLETEIPHDICDGDEAVEEIKNAYKVYKKLLAKLKNKNVTRSKKNSKK